MKISKKEFVKAMTENMTIFAGIVRGNFDAQYAMETIREQMERIKRDGIIVEKRSCVARSHDLRFCNGSYLELDRREFEKLDCGNCTMYICHDYGMCICGDEYNKRMIYIVEK